MSWTFSKTTSPVARKDYHCEASDWISNSIGYDDELSEEDQATWEKAQEEGCKILKGTRYQKVTGKYEGEMSTYRARLDLDDICCRYSLYPDYD